MRTADETFTKNKTTKRQSPDLSGDRTPSLAVIRAKCQESVEAFNDPMGRIFGSRISVHFTRLCLRLGIPANWVSYAMLGSGIAGSLALLGGGVFSAVGFALLIAYYILDCVDGEVARFRGQTNIEMAAFDYLCHIIVKGLMFACLGIGFSQELSAGPILLYACLAALLATMLQKSLGELPRLLFTQKILDQGRYLDGRTICKNLGIDPVEGDLVGPQDKHKERVGPVAPADLPLRSQVRFLSVNFDFGNFLFLIAALLDLWVLSENGFEVVSGLRLNAKAVLAVGYGIILPLNFLDHLVTFIRSGRLKRDVKAYWLTTQSFSEVQNKAQKHPEDSESP